MNQRRSQDEGRPELPRKMRKALRAIHKKIASRLDAVRITAQIQSALDLLEPGIGLQVNVDTDQGVVFLRGTVASEEQRTAAEGIARAVCPRGVERIVNELEVNPELPPILLP
jgi:osmotically-inducible protein OsmY